MEDIEQINRKLKDALRALQDVAAARASEVLRTILDPALVMRTFESLGLNARAFSAGSNPYHVLGLEPSASEAEVKKRYRELLRKLHPDTGGVEGATWLLEMVVSAYETIKKERGWQ